jgi:hypothetical protein
MSSARVFASCARMARRLGGKHHLRATGRDTRLSDSEIRVHFAA